MAEPFAETSGSGDPGLYWHEAMAYRRRLHAGKKEERAFLTALLGRAYPHLVRRLPENTMRRNVTVDWDGLVRRYRGPVDDQRLFTIPALQLVIALTSGNYGIEDQWVPPTRVLREVVLASVT
jgi:hypothetical protein